MDVCLLKLLSLVWVLNVNAHEGHEHYIPKAGEVNLSDQRLRHDVSHIKEDIEAYFQGNFSIEQMTPKDLEYYYFVLHDFDKNNKLDGLEMMKAIQHIVEHTTDPEPATEEHVKNYAKAIDMLLEQDDWDRDGFINYQEYVYVQQKQAAATA